MPYKKAYELAKQVNPNAGGIRTEEERRILFGQTAASIAAAAAAAAIEAAVWPNRILRSSSVRMPPAFGLTCFASS